MGSSGFRCRTRVKICGITRAEDGLEAARSGADAIGLVFYSRSPRAVDVTRALEIIAVLPPFVTRVGLFVDAGEDDVRAISKKVPLDLLQFHGNEPADYCRMFDKPYIKAVAVSQEVDIAARLRDYGDAAGFLLDAWHPEVPGGSGERFDWRLVPDEAGKPVILAGGLQPDNVAAAIRQIRPYAVDVSSGVEAAKGIKDAAKLKAFFRGVQSADD